VEDSVELCAQLISQARLQISLQTVSLGGVAWQRKKACYILYERYLYWCYKWYIEEQLQLRASLSEYVIKLNK